MENNSEYLIANTFQILIEPRWVLPTKFLLHHDASHKICKKNGTAYVL